MVKIFHQNNGKPVTVYINPELIDPDEDFRHHEEGQILFIKDENDEKLFYGIVLRYENIYFESFIVDDEPSPDGSFHATRYWEIMLPLSECDILLLDADLEILVTRNWDVFRIPFRYLLNSSADDAETQLEFLGNHSPSVVERLCHAVVRDRRVYHFDDLYI